LLLAPGAPRIRSRAGRFSTGAENGVTAVEYALMTAVIVALLVGGIALLSSAVHSRFDRNASCASVAWRGGGC
jgi:Flp pilus assembly pilin Flp